MSIYAHKRKLKELWLNLLRLPPSGLIVSEIKSPGRRRPTPILPAIFLLCRVLTLSNCQINVTDAIWNSWPGPILSNSVDKTPPTFNSVSLCPALFIFLIQIQRDLLAEWKRLNSRTPWIEYDNVVVWCSAVWVLVVGVQDGEYSPSLLESEVRETDCYCCLCWYDPMCLCSSVVFHPLAEGLCGSNFA